MQGGPARGPIEHAIDIAQPLGDADVQPGDGYVLVGSAVEFDLSLVPEALDVQQVRVVVGVSFAVSPQSRMPSPLGVTSA
jgi:hypothetical protein